MYHYISDKEDYDTRDIRRGDLMRERAEVLRQLSIEEAPARQAELRERRVHSPHRITITKAEIYKNDLVKRVQKIKDIDESLYIQIKTAINIYSLKKNRN